MICNKCGIVIVPGDTFAVVYNTKEKKTYALCFDCSDKTDDEEEENNDVRPT